VAPNDTSITPEERSQFSPIHAKATKRFRQVEPLRPFSLG
jgi:hypothetical protein